MCWKWSLEFHTCVQIRQQNSRCTPSDTGWKELCNPLCSQYLFSEMWVFLICDALHCYHLCSCCLLPTGHIKVTDRAERWCLTGHEPCAWPQPLLKPSVASIWRNLPPAGTAQLQPWCSRSCSSHKNSSQDSSVQLSPLPIPTASQPTSLFPSPESLYGSNVEFMEGPLFSWCKVLSNKSTCILKARSSVLQVMNLFLGACNSLLSVTIFHCFFVPLRRQALLLS